MLQSENTGLVLWGGSDCNEMWNVYCLPIAYLIIHRCDFCIKGPPKCESLIKEAEILLRVLVELQSSVNYGQSDLNNKRTGDHHFGRCSEMVSFKEVIERVI